MKKFLKIIGITFGVIILLLFLTAGIVYIVFPPEKVMETVKVKVKEATGRDVEIGSADLKFYRGIGFSLKDFSMANPSGFGEPNMIELKSVDIRAQLYPLFQKRLVIDDITFHEPKINLIVERDSTKNFIFEAKEKSSEKEKDSGVLPISISLPVRIKNGRLDYVDKIQKQEIFLENLNSVARITTDKKTQILDILLDLGIEQGKVRQADKAMLPFDPFPLQVKFSILIFLKEQDYNLSELNLKIGELVTQITSEGAWQENSAKLNSLTIALGKTELSAKAELTDLTNPTGTYEINLDSDLNDLFIQVPLEEKPIKSVSGAIKAGFIGDFQMDSTGIGENIARLIPQGSMDFSNINVEVDDRTPKIEGISGKLSLKNKKLDLQNFVAKIGQSSVNFQVSTDLSSLQKPEDWENLAINYVLTGDINLAEVKEQAPPEFPAKSLSGRIKLNLSDRILPKSDLQNYANLIPSGEMDISEVTADLGDTLPRIDILNAELILKEKGKIEFYSGASLEGNEVKLDGTADLSGFKKLEDTDKVNVNFDLHSPGINLNTLMAKSDKTSQKQPKPQEKSASPLPPLPTIIGKAVINNLIYEEYTMGNVKADIALMNNILTINNLSMKIEEDSDITASGTVDLTEFKTPEDIEKIRANLTVNSNHMNLNKILPPKEEQKKSSAKKKKESQEIPPMPQFTVKARVKKLNYEKYQMENVDAKISQKDKVLNLENFDMNIFGGIADLKGSYSMPDTAYDMSVKVEGTRSNEFLATLYEPLENHFFGELFFDADVKGRGADPEKVKQNLISNGSFTFRQGKVVNFDFLQLASDVVSIYNFDEIVFDKSKSPFRIEDNKFYLEDLDMDTKDAYYKVDGYSTLDGDLNYKARILLSKSKSDKVQFPKKEIFLNEEGRFIIDLKITGKGKGTRVVWDKSYVEEKAKEKISQEVDKLKDQAESKMDSTKGEVKEKIEEEGKKILKGIFGDDE